MTSFEIYDIETLLEIFTYTGYNCRTKLFKQFVICEWRNDLDVLIEYLKDLIKNDCYQVGFNNDNFDYPVIHHLLNHYEEYKDMPGKSVAFHLYQKAQELTEKKEEKQFNTIADRNKYLQLIDLFKLWGFDSKARITSLKDLEIVFRMHNVEDMPIPHYSHCKKEDEEIILSYNLNDVKTTYLLFKYTLGQTDDIVYKDKNKLRLRIDLMKRFNVNILTMSDVRMGEKLMLNLYARSINKDVKYVKNLKTYRQNILLNDCVPSWCDSSGDLTKEFLRNIDNVSVAVPLPENAFSFSIYDWDLNYQWNFGIGGTHGATKPGIYYSDDNYVLVDQDVNAMYPSLAEVLKIYPEHLGIEFNQLYTGFIHERLTEKAKPSDIRDNSLVEGLKLMLNGGTFGKTNEPSSYCYDPLYFLKTTIAGQILMCMWSDRLINSCKTVQFISSNTDGQLVRIHRSELETLRSVMRQLEQDTGLTFEETLYSKVIHRDVNTYIAQYIDSDKLKLKGDFEINKELHKDHSMRIVPIALKKYFIDGIPVEKTIRNHDDIFDFCLRLKLKGSTKGLFSYYDNGIKEKELSKTTRYYISNDSKAGSLFKQFGENKKSRINVGFSAMLFNQYEQKEMKDYNINYSFYIQEAKKIINVIEPK